MVTISQVIADATEVLRKSGIAEPRREAGSLLALALGKDRTFLITQSETKLSEEQFAGFEALLKRRAAREPFQYIAGKQEFYGLDFRVTPAVLIPRPETEMIVENALEIFGGIEQPRFCEVGVGSGCISIAILSNLPDATAVGFEISPEAIEVIRMNSENLNIAKRFEILQSDVFGAATGERFDLIVSNPPYIPASDMAGLQAEVRDFEPRNALTDGADGLSIVRRIVGEAPRFLKDRGYLLMEIGFGQAAAVGAMFEPDDWRGVEILNDLQEIPRMVKAQYVKS